MATARMLVADCQHSHVDGSATYCISVALMCTAGTWPAVIVLHHQLGGVPTVACVVEDGICAQRTPGSDLRHGLPGLLLVAMAGGRERGAVARGRSVPH